MSTFNLDLYSKYVLNKSDRMQMAGIDTDGYIDNFDKSNIKNKQLLKNKQHIVADLKWNPPANTLTGMNVNKKIMEIKVLFNKKPINITEKIFNKLNNKTKRPYS